HFAIVASPDGMTVQVTPLSADSLGLAVVTKRLSGIEVKELQRGTGNYDFDWEVKCVRKGHEDYQVTRSRNEMALPDHLGRLALSWRTAIFWQSEDAWDAEIDH